MNLQGRRYIILLIFALIGVIFIIRLFFMQVLSDEWEERANVISGKRVDRYPERGIIYDRNGVKLVDNVNYYDIMVIPSEIEDLDTLGLCELLGIDRETFEKRLEVARTQPNSPYVPSVFSKEIPQEQFNVIQEEIWKYKPGFFPRDRTLRYYPEGIAAHVLGYLNEVSPKDIERNDYYKPGDYVGRSGLEKAYEEQLRGRRGVQYMLKDAIGLESGSLKGGKFDTLPIPGSDLYTSLDAKLQAYGEQLMQNKMGSIVAIEPKTGEILSMVSAPGYDPNLLVGRERNKYFPALNKDTLSPMFNRTITARYPPGSIFKMIQALIGMREGVLSPSTRYVCDGTLIGDHVTGYLDMYTAIKSSSNQWFLLAYKAMIQRGKYTSHFKDSRHGLALWSKAVKTYGLGSKMENELIADGLYEGKVPDVELYDKWYGEGRWAFSTIYSNAIGQGEIELTPLQMANLGAIIANKGYFYNPHFVTGIDAEGIKRDEFKVKNFVHANRADFDTIHAAMRGVVEEAGGTARLARIDGVTICGKTGTAENPHGEDHSVFLAFAPMDDPQIAIAVYVENAGYGGVWAAPIASLMVEYYLTGQIKDKRKEQRILDKDFIHPEKNNGQQW